MSSTTIDLYLEETLTVQLKNKSMSQEQIKFVVDDVKSHLEFMAGIWKAKDSRRALLEVAREEATNYSPKKLALPILRSCIILPATLTLSSVVSSALRWS